MSALEGKKAESWPTPWDLKGIPGIQKISSEMLKVGP